LEEVIGNYPTHMILSDSWLEEIPEYYRQKFCAYYLTQASKHDKEVMIAGKQDDLSLDV
jgi:alpha-L-fucosidase